MAKKQVNKKIVNNGLQPRYKITFRDKEFEAKLGLKVFMKYEQLYGKIFGQDLENMFTELLQLYYVTTLVYSDYKDLTFDEFIDELDECPELMYDYNDFFALIQESNTKNVGE